jgi:hypothetical protein
VGSEVNLARCFLMLCLDMMVTWHHGDQATTPDKPGCFEYSESREIKDSAYALRIEMNFL